ncbi:MAG TPA: ribonuclease domain-containing protein [Jatrophihabitans sp.]
MPRIRRPLIALIVLIAALLIGYLVNALKDDGNGTPKPTTSVSSSAGVGLSPVALSTLPPQAADTVRLIRAGGPFPYPQNDGVVFHNNEHVLPKHPDGWYHEYTVPTPGSSTRGARRIILGEDGTYYYTGDHYETFDVIDIGA